MSRTRRQELILTLISDKPIRNQSELLKELEAAGVTMTQSTLSRELKALGIAKTPDAGGGYRYTSGEPSGRGPLSPLVAFVRKIERAKNLIVVRTPPGNAQGVAHGLDEVAWPEVNGDDRRRRYDPFDLPQRQRRRRRREPSEGTDQTLGLAELHRISNVYAVRERFVHRAPLSDLRQSDSLGIVETAVQGNV